MGNAVLWLTIGLAIGVVFTFFRRSYWRRQGRDMEARVASDVHRADAVAREILTETISNRDGYNIGRVREICGDVPTEYVLYAMTTYATSTWNKLSDLSGRDPAEAWQSVMLRVVRSEMEDGEDAS